MTTLLLLHGNSSVTPKYQAALPGAKLVVVTGLSDGEYAQLGKQSITAYLDDKAPGWTKPLLLAGFSAGGFGVREFLNDAANRAAIDTAIFLDGTYGTADGKCITAPYDGAVKYAQQGGKLVITYSDAHPGPKTCAHAINVLAGGKPILVPSGIADHGAQLSEVGPQVVASNYVGNAPPPRAARVGTAWVIAIGLAAAAYWVVRS